MMNTKAQIFEIWLVVLTITMCLVVVGFYYFQQNQIQNSIILPKELLNLQNDKQMFEIQEKQILAQSLRDALASSSETADGFVFIFRNKFFASILKPEQEAFRTFLFNSKLDNQDISKQALTDQGVQVYYLEQVYSFEQIYFTGSDDYKIIVKRKPIGKFLLLKPGEKNKIAFNIRVDYSFAKEYTLSSGYEIPQEAIVENVLGIIGINTGNKLANSREITPVKGSKIVLIYGNQKFTIDYDIIFLTKGVNTEPFKILDLADSQSKIRKSLSSLDIQKIETDGIEIKGQIKTFILRG